MTTVTGLTASRMQEIIDTTVVDGHIAGDDLILTTNDSTEINAGNVRGPMGPSGGGHFICTSSTHPTYTAGEEGKTIYETDTNLVRIWNGTRFEIQGPVICTSTTRPSSGLTSADEGIEIYETDTGFRYFWSGTAWRRIPGDMGRLGAVNLTTTVDCLDTLVTVISVPITVVEERVVLVTAYANGLQVTAAATLVAAHVDSIGATSSPIRNVFYGNSLGNGDSIVGSLNFTAQIHPGTTTFRLRARDLGSGAIRMQEDTQLSVVDVAPA